MHTLPLPAAKKIHGITKTGDMHLEIVTNLFNHGKASRRISESQAID